MNAVTRYTFSITIDLPNNEEDNQPDYSGRDIEKLVFRALRAHLDSARTRAIVDGELMDTATVNA